MDSSTGPQRHEAGPGDACAGDACPGHVCARGARAEEACAGDGCGGDACPGDVAHLRALLASAVEDRARAEARASSLTRLAHALSGAGSTTAVADLLAAALPEVLGCDSGAVWLWDPERGEVRASATAGLTPALHEALLQMPVRPGDSPELGALLATAEPLVLNAGAVSAVLDEILAALGLRSAIGVALLSGSTLLGAVTGSWVEQPLAGAHLEETIKRLQGVADHAATALLNARLVEEARHQALHDALTGLPNRVLFSERLDEAARAASRDGGSAVLFCDVDRFKELNDGLGHGAGDEALRQIARRLTRAVRPGDTVARLSGDEFAVLLPGVFDHGLALEVAERVTACFDEPLHLEGRQVRLTISVGAALHAGADLLPGPLLRAADAAMYAAKRRGRNQIAVGPVTGAGTLQPGRSLRTELWSAAEAGQLRVLLQPLWSLRGGAGHDGAGHEGVSHDGVGHGGVGQLVGAEALVRWEHPRLGLLRPAAFVPLADQDGSIVELDLWVLREACRHAARWPADGDRRHVAVNLSVRTLGDPQLYDAVRHALLAAALPPSCLQLEVVESRALADLPGVVERLTALRHLGVAVALDDFGTGFSTLSWLQELPVDRLKVDRSFVGDLAGDDPRRRRVATALLRGIVRVGEDLDVEVLAEGIEDEEQLAAVRDTGCGYAQGFLLGRPQAPELFAGLLATGRGTPTSG